MRVQYLRWDGEEFSRSWYWIARRAVRLGIIKITDVNDAHRSMALQAQRVREHGEWSPANPTGAAPPTPAAPHIRVGREDHALDVQTTAIGRFMAWLAGNGVPTHRPVLEATDTEPWHMEALTEGELIHFGRACEEDERPPRYTALELHLLHRPLGRVTRLALKAQARRIQRAARSHGRRGGWGIDDRAKRFHGLRKRALS